MKIEKRISTMCRGRISSRRVRSGGWVCAWRGIAVGSGGWVCSRRRICAGWWPARVTWGWIAAWGRVAHD